MPDGTGEKVAHLPRDASPTTWRSFLRTLAGAAILLACAVYGATLALDPYGSRTSATRAPTPIMDVNQRYMYPQLTRSGRFDAAVFGTSTVRLLDPVQLDKLFGSRFVNLAINGGTPWEQMQLADLFLRHVPRPTGLLFGLDRNWCDPDAARPEKRLTFRPFPPWLYDEDPFNDVPATFSLKSVEIAWRVLLNRLGLMPARIREDGYENFLPPERRYDAARAARQIRFGHAEPMADPAPQGEMAGGETFPAFGWLDEILARLPSGTPVTLVFPPIHVAAQAAPGSPGAVQDGACKAAAKAVAGPHGAVLLDFRIPSRFTREDANYWDRLHFRVPLADGLAATIAEGAKTGRADDDAIFRVLSPGR